MIIIIMIIIMVIIMLLVPLFLMVYLLCLSLFPPVVNIVHLPMRLGMRLLFNLGPISKSPPPYGYPMLVVVYALLV